MQELNVIDMFWNAGLVVKFVMLLLLSFSMLSWVIIFQKFFLFRRARNESEQFLKAFWKSKNLADASQYANKMTICSEAHIFLLGYNELQKLNRKRDSSDEEENLEMRLAGMENLKRALIKAENLESQRLGNYLSFLATTGSASPFIGLFGTVWGIMASFKEIGHRGSATLAVVAPGISEALVATAAGLAVAIPAVIFFNFYANQITELENRMHSFSSDFLNLVERDLISRLP